MDNNDVRFQNFCLTVATYLGLRQAFNQWQGTFHLKAALPSAERVMAASYVISKRQSRGRGH